MFDELIEETKEQEEVQASFNYDDWLIKKVQEYKNNNTLDQTETNLRYRDASNIRWAEDSEVLVVGLGTIGGIALPVLSNLSFKNITAVDPDTIEIHNVHNQDYDVVDIGLPKVEAMRKKILRHNGVNIRAEQQKIVDMSQIEGMFGGKFPDIVYIGVDNMEFRNRFWRHMAHAARYEDPQKLPELVIDARMTLGTFNVIALPLRKLGRTAEGAINQVYNEYCFSDEEGLQERCTARSIIFCATAIASYTAALINWYGNNRRELNVNGFMDVRDPNTDFKWVHSFNAMDWRMISKTPHELRMQSSIQNLKQEITVLEETLERKKQGESKLISSYKEIQYGLKEYKVVFNSSLQIVKGIFTDFTLDEEGEIATLILYRNGMYAPLRADSIMNLHELPTDISDDPSYKDALPGDTASLTQSVKFYEGIDYLTSTQFEHPNYAILVEPFKAVDYDNPIWAQFKGIPGTTHYFKCIRYGGVIYRPAVMGEDPYTYRTQGSPEYYFKEVNQRARAEAPTVRRRLLETNEHEIFDDTLLAFSEDPECLYTLELTPGAQTSRVTLYPQEDGISEIVLTERVFRSMLQEGEIDVRD